MRKYEDFPLNAFGIWDIYGEDPNCDMMGHHHQPFLERVKGTYADAIEYAYSLPDFVQWGSGGEINKFRPMEIRDITGFSDGKVFEEIEDLKKAMAEAEEAMNKAKKAIEEREQLLVKKGR